MNRRNLIKTVGFGVGLLNMPGYNQLGILAKANPESVPLIDHLFEANDQVVVELLSNQNRITKSEEFGGFPDRYGIHHPGSAGGAIQRFALAYSQKKSTFYNSEKIFAAINLALDFLVRKQHEDGTIDLLTTNFHSTPDLAFVVEPVALGYTLIRNFILEDQIMLTKFEGFFLKAGNALSVGGIHTPNHRWVVSMALARINHLFPNRKYVNRVETWLKEKIDIDADGQYTERSTSVYSPLTNRCLITIGRMLNKPNLLNPVRKNLDMTVYLMHPNGEVVTEVSRRQDQFQAKDLVPYYYSYLYLAHHDNNPIYGAMAQSIEQNASIKQLSGSLIYLLEDPGLQKLPNVSQLPIDYIKHFKHLELVRIRRDNLDVSILAKNATFFTFHRGMAVLQAIRFATAFFGKGQFIAEQLHTENNRYVLSQQWRGPYYQPYPQEQLPDNGDWEKMPRDNRPQSEVQSLEAKVTIYEEDPGMVLDIQINGTDYVPVAIELAFRRGGTISGARQLDQSAGTYIFDQESIKYTYQEDEINITGFRPAHEWTQLRGAAPKVNADCVYLTGFTPFKEQIKIY